MKLSPEYSLLVYRQRTNRLAAINTSDRAWLLDPAGKVYSCGYSHKLCQLEFPDIFQKGEGLIGLVDRGWAKIGVLVGEKLNFLYLRAVQLSNIFFHHLQDFASRLGFQDDHQVQLILGPNQEDVLSLPYREFKKCESPADVIRLREYKKRVSTITAQDHSWVIPYEWRITHDDKDKRVWSTFLNEEEAEVIGVITNSPLKTKNGRGTQRINPSQQTKIGLVGPLEAYLTHDDENDYQLQVHTNNKLLRLPKSVSVGALLDDLKQNWIIPCHWENHGMTEEGFYLKETYLSDDDAELLMTVLRSDHVPKRENFSAYVPSLGKSLGLLDTYNYYIELVYFDGSYHLSVHLGEPFVRLPDQIDLEPLDQHSKQ
jgi:hypothetical protein